MRDAARGGADAFGTERWAPNVAPASAMASVAASAERGMNRTMGDTGRSLSSRLIDSARISRRSSQTRGQGRAFGNLAAGPRGWTVHLTRRGPVRSASAIARDAIAAVLPVLGGIVPLLPENPLMPFPVRAAHAVEIATYYALYGALIATWFGVRGRTSDTAVGVVAV